MSKLRVQPVPLLAAKLALLVKRALLLLLLLGLPLWLSLCSAARGRGTETLVALTTSHAWCVSSREGRGTVAGVAETRGSGEFGLGSCLAGATRTTVESSRPVRHRPRHVVYAWATSGGIEAACVSRDGGAQRAVARCLRPSLPTRQHTTDTTVARPRLQEELRKVYAARVVSIKQTNPES